MPYGLVPARLIALMQQLRKSRECDAVDVVGSTARVFELIHVEKRLFSPRSSDIKKIERYCKNVANLALCGDPQAPYQVSARRRESDEHGIRRLHLRWGCAKVRAVAAEAIDVAPSARLGASPSALTESIPLSHAQRALWLHHASAPDSSVLQFERRLPGRFDPSTLRLALNSLVQRHPMLRLRICVEGEPVQRILTSTPRCSTWLMDVRGTKPPCAGASPTPRTSPSISRKALCSVPRCSRPTTVGRSCCCLPII